MDEQLDTGDIAAQAEVDLPDGVSGEEADSTLSQYGAELLLDVLRQLETGRLVRRAQPADGSYFPAPQDTRLCDRHGVVGAARLQLHARHQRMAAAVSDRSGRATLHAQAGAGSTQGHEVLDQPYRLLGDQIDIQFSPGVLRALLA